MARVTTEAKQKYQEEIKDYKEKVDSAMGAITALEKEARLKTDSFSNYRRVIISNEYLQVVSLYCNMNDVSMDRLNRPNEAFLNDARKYLLKAITLLEEVVSDEIDAPLNENEERLKTIEEIDPKRKINLIRKLGYHISLVQDAFGENSKWRWSFVELEGRYAAILKNIIDYRACQSNHDPRKPFFAERNELMSMVKDQLANASKRYREKYELSTREPNDMKRAMTYLNSLRRIHILFGMNDEAQNLKRTIELYKQQMEDNIKKMEAERKKSKTRAKAK